MTARNADLLEAILTDDSSIVLGPDTERQETRVIVVHLPWPPSFSRTSVSGANLIEPIVEDDDLANATWEDAEWR